ncbi:MAG: hypothetical protein C4K60_21430 [Ideonella sp. MAG2]|nr:MAG: hypothetical protein C4K60_21430 [Ideonella sp. MAG2]
MAKTARRAAIRKNAVRAARKHQQAFALAAHVLMNCQPVGHRALIAWNTDHIFGGGDVEVGNVDTAHHGGEVTLTIERRSGQKHHGLEPVFAQVQSPALSNHTGTGSQHQGIGPIGVTHADHTLCIQALAPRRSRQHLVQGKAQVLHPGNGLFITGCALQALDQAQGVAPPYLPVRTRVLQV